jgi:hypothetical protein
VEYGTVEDVRSAITNALDAKLLQADSCGLGRVPSAKTAMANRFFYRSMSKPSRSYRSTRADAADVVDALAYQQGDARRKLKGRRHVRRSWVTTIDIQIEERSTVGSHTRELRVTTCDVSRGGFSFTHGHLIHPGSRVRVRFDCLPGAPVLTGTVRHCRHVRGTEHHVGVEFDQCRAE